nr:TIM barrel protein [Sneathiella limimaris]
MFQEVAFLERFRAAATVGFQGVEYLFPYEYTAKQLHTLLEDFNLQQALFNLYPGEWSQGERGLAALPNREDEFKSSVEQALEYASHLKCSKLHVMSGLKLDQVSTELQLETYMKNLLWAADQAKNHNVTLLIEPINPFDMPGYFLSDFAQAKSILEDINHPNLAMQFDIYHCQRLQGNIVSTLIDYLPLIGHIQIANPPGRHEPGKGELNFDFILNWLSTQYDGWVGCEYTPSAVTTDCLSWAEPYLENYPANH